MRRHYRAVRDCDNSPLSREPFVAKARLTPVHRKSIRQNLSIWSTTMTPEQKALVKTTWSQVVPIADMAAKLFYGKLFEIDPSTRQMFKSTDMPEQRKKLMQALATVIAGLDNLAPLIPVLETLGRKHVAYGVVDQHYASVGAALLWTLEQGLQDAWTPPVKDAWIAAYTAVAGVMRNSAKDVQAAA
jgi:hemoglobin-like flavoprotein